MGEQTMDRAWIRQHAAEKIKAMYGLKNPSTGEIAKMTETVFGPNPILQFPGFRQKNPLFGCHQGHDNINAHYQLFYSIVEVSFLEQQYTLVDGFSASVHCEAEFKFKESGSVFKFELIALVEFDFDGRFRTIKLFFDTANFTKALKNHDSVFSDVREKDPHPKFDPDSRQNAGAVMSTIYNSFLKCYEKQAPYETLWSQMSEEVEVCFKSDVDVLPYAGQYSGKEGFQQWLKDLFSIWSLASFNYTRIFAEGNIADFEIHELHYYNNPDGSRRYLDVYIVQSWLVDETGKLHRFKSYHDSLWLIDVLHITDVYKAHYGYPKDYPPHQKPGKVSPVKS
jgi:hypothetical protein